MNNIIDFLSEYGEKGAFVSDEEIKSLTVKHQLNSEQVNAILSNQSANIANLLDVDSNIYAILVPAEDDDDNDDSEESEDIAA